MAKLIAVCGSPSSGKTTVSLKLAMGTYAATGGAATILLSPDMSTPTVGLLFPNYTPNEIRSLSAVLDGTVISPELIIENLVTVSKLQNFGVLGLKSGESRFSFPQPTAEKISSILHTLVDISDYVIVDCSGDPTDALSQDALRLADHVIRVITPDLKGMAWFMSNKNLPQTEEEKLLNAVSVTDKDMFLPIEEVCSSLPSVEAILPYSRTLRQQMSDGRLYEPAKDRAYDMKLRQLTGRVI